MIYDFHTQIKFINIISVAQDLLQYTHRKLSLLKGIGGTEAYLLT